jgi:spore photoproduct lyase
MLQRFPHSRLAVQEMILAPDGKLRYFKDMRQELYGRLLEWLRAAAPDAVLYLCMESPRLWRAVFGMAPSPADLAGWLDRRIAAPV